MTVEIVCGDISSLPSSEQAAGLLAVSGSDTLALACADSTPRTAYRVLRTVMDYGNTHAQPAQVRLVCADEAVYKSYRFQWNMWYAAHKPEHSD